MTTLFTSSLMFFLCVCILHYISVTISHPSGESSMLIIINVTFGVLLVNAGINLISKHAFFEDEIEEYHKTKNLGITMSLSKLHVRRNMRKNSTKNPQSWTSLLPFSTGSSLLLITALNSGVNKTCWQHVTACDIKEVYIKTWFMCGSQDSSIRQLQVHSSALPCLWVASEASSLQEGHRLLRMCGVKVWAKEEEPTHTNETLFWCFWSSSSGKMENVCVWPKETETVWAGAHVQCLYVVCMCGK